MAHIDLVPGLTPREQLSRLERAFTPPSMLAMPYARYEDRWAAQEDAYMVWRDVRDAHEIHDQRDEETRQQHLCEAADAVAFGIIKL